MWRQQFYLITGVFFSEGTHYGLGFDPEMGPRVGIQTVIKHALFSGVIDAYADEGALQDHYGVSTLILTKTSDNEFEFIKRYDGRSDTITYRFFKTKDGDGYVGYWEQKEGEHGICGSARCFIKGINQEEFFDYKKADELLVEFNPPKLFEMFKLPQKEKEEPTGSAVQPADDLPF